MLPPTLAPLHEEGAAISPTNERKSVESTVASVPAVTLSGAGSRDGPPVMTGTVHGVERVAPVPPANVADELAERLRVPARKASPAYVAVSSVPAGESVSV